MAHGTLIGGTAYGITGGKALIGGTAYGISKGRTLIDGTGYDISFGPQPAKTRMLLSDTTYAPMTAMTFANGNWIVACSKQKGTLYFMWGSDPGGDWTVKTLPLGWWSVTSITYANGYYVMTLAYPTMTYFDGYTNVASIYYATSLNGPWTEVILQQEERGKEAGAYDIAYGDGYWVVCGKSDSLSAKQSAGGIWYATDLAGPWTFNTVYPYANLTTVTYANGYWAVSGEVSVYKSDEAKIAYATNPANTFTSKSLWATADWATTKINDIVYTNGYWVAGGNTVSDDGKSVAQIAYATSLSGTWTVKQLWGGVEANNDSRDEVNTVKHIKYTNGYWTFCGDYHTTSNTKVYMAYSENLADTPTIAQAWEGDRYGWNYLDNGIFCNYANGYWVVGGWRYGSSSTPKSTTQLVYGKSLECFERA